MLHGQVVTVAFSQKLEDSRSCELCRIKSIANQVCIRNLEMIDGNNKKLFLPSPSKFFTFSKIHLEPKISRYNWKLTQLGNDVYL